MIGCITAIMKTRGVFRFHAAPGLYSLNSPAESSPPPPSADPQTIYSTRLPSLVFLLTSSTHLHVAIEQLTKQHHQLPFR